MRPSFWMLACVLVACGETSSPLDSGVVAASGGGGGGTIATGGGSMSGGGSAGGGAMSGGGAGGGSATGGGTGSVGCAPLTFDTLLTTSATNANGTVTLSVLEVSSLGGISGTIPLFTGAPAALSSLPQTTTVHRQAGEAVTIGEVVLRGGQHYAMESGTITLLAVTLPLAAEVELRARLENATFRQVARVSTDAGLVSVTGGPLAACLEVAALDIDTTVAVGTPCDDVVNCGANKACSPLTQTCVASQCQTDANCGASQSCVTQRLSPVEVRACYTRCDPAANTCGAGFDCVRRFSGPPTHGDWICLRTGQGAPGASCDEFATGGARLSSTTRCVSGYGCPSGINPRCLKRCDVFAAVPGCANGELCVDGLCGGQAVTGASAAQLGEPCMAGQLCGSDGMAYRGVCGLSMSCKASCELGTTCPGGSCVPALGNRGVCP